MFVCGTNSIVSLLRLKRVMWTIIPYIYYALKY